MRATFPAACRLRSAKEIQAVLARRDIFRGKRLIFYRGLSPAAAEAGPKEAAEPITRFCLMVSRRCGGAVRRNRIKRVLREIIRLNRYRIPAGYDYVIRARASGIENEEINQDLLRDDFSGYFGWA